MTINNKKSNTWGFGYDGKYEKPKDYEHNERLHQEKLVRKAAKMQAGLEHNQRLHEEAEARKAERKLQAQIKAAEQNQKLIDDAEARKKEREVQRDLDNRGFEWGGKKYTLSGKIKRIK